MSPRRTRATRPEWSSEPIDEQLARIGAGYRDRWPDEATRAIVMGAVDAATAHYRQKWRSVLRANQLLRTALRERQTGSGENPQ